MTAPRGYRHQTGAGRTTTGAAKVPEVESLPCPSGGLHRLANTRAGVTRCLGCRETWAALDAAVRAS